MAAAIVPLIPRDGTILINDGAALALTIQYEDGDFGAAGLRQGQMQLVQFKDRGITYSVRKSEDANSEFSWSCHAIALLGDGTTAQPTDALLKLGVWAAATSLIPTGKGDAYLVKITFTGERTDFSATADTTIVLKYCDAVLDFSEGLPGKLTIKGTNYPFSTDSVTLTG